MFTVHGKAGRRALEHADPEHGPGGCRQRVDDLRGRSAGGRQIRVAVELRMAQRDDLLGRCAAAHQRRGQQGRAGRLRGPDDERAAGRHRRRERDLIGQLQPRRRDSRVAALPPGRKRDRDRARRCGRGERRCRSSPTCSRTARSRIRSPRLRVSPTTASPAARALMGTRRCPVTAGSGAGVGNVGSGSGSGSGSTSGSWLGLRRRFWLWLWLWLRFWLWLGFWRSRRPPARARLAAQAQARQLGRPRPPARVRLALPARAGEWRRT